MTSQTSYTKRLTDPRGDGRMTGEEIRSVVEQLKGIVAILQNADPEDRRAVYQELNVSIRYHTDGRLHVKAGPSACTNECVGGGSTPGLWRVATRNNPQPPALFGLREATSRRSTVMPVSSRTASGYSTARTDRVVICG